MKLSLISTSTKVAAVAIALLALSVWGNVHQHYSKAIDREKAIAEGFAKAAKVNRDIAHDQAADTRALLKDLGEIADRGRTERVVYQKAAAKKPLDAKCAPGAGRINAVNAGADR